MANMEKIDSVMLYITTHINAWDQGKWAAVFENGYDLDTLIDMVFTDPYLDGCDSALCMAGHTVNQNGYRLIYNAEHTLRGRGDDAKGCLYTESCVPDDLAKDLSPSEVRSQAKYIKSVAMHILEIDLHAADLLFDSDNDLETLQNMVEHLREEGNLDGWSTLTNDTYDDDADDNCGDDDCQTCNP